MMVIRSTMHDFTVLLNVTRCPDELGRGDSMASDRNGAIEKALVGQGKLLMSLFVGVIWR